MNPFERFVHFLSAEMPNTQAPFGWFHILAFLITIAFTVILCIKQKDCSDKTFRRILLIIWVTLVIFEIYKQIVSPFSAVDGKAVWNYDLNDIPFQFCSSILFCLPPIIFLKDGKLRDGFMAFSTTFVFLAGFMVIVYPDQLKDDRAIGICVQTMVHHGAQVAVGVLVAIRERERLSKNFFIKGLAVFGGFLAAALVLNLILSPAVTGNDAINFFYISPYHNCPLPILSDIRKAVPWILSFAIYIVGFIALAALIAFIFYLITRKITSAPKCAEA